jgi:hypothetical protein
MMQEMSLDLFGERFAVFSPAPSMEELNLAKALAEDAADQADEAETEREYAEMARTLIAKSESAESRRELCRIAVWHYEQCAQGFRQAVAGFESSAKIQKASAARRRLLEKAGRFAELAMQAELAVLELNRGEKKKEGGSNNETG